MSACVYDELRDDLAAQPLSNCIVFSLKFKEIVSPCVCDVVTFSIALASQCIC